jgi:DNA-binding response OmpR family regulator
MDAFQTAFKGKILVVEDEPRLRAIISVQLRSAGFDVLSVERGDLALSLLANLAPDLILLDAVVPGISGYEFCRRVRADKRVTHVPIVFLSAKATAEDRERGLRAGANDYITKPWEVTELRLRISNLLELTRKHRERAIRELTGETAGGAHASVFISYGGPDEGFATRLNSALQKRGVSTFLFCEDATPGEKVHRVVHEGINRQDHVVLVCSRKSLDRPGVLNEIEVTLQREAREGGRSILIPITLDDYVFTGWTPPRPDLGDAIRDRVVADFSAASSDPEAFGKAVDLLLDALLLSRSRA